MSDYDSICAPSNNLQPERLRSHRLYGVWAAMKNRCYNPRVKSFRSYGAKGVVVCQRWRSSFANFLRDMGDRPTPQHSIDRRDPTGNYSCGKCEECVGRGWVDNCRWATPEMQQANRRNIMNITSGGITKSLTEWSKITGLSKGTIWARLAILGWTPERAMTEKSRHSRRVQGT